MTPATPFLLLEGIRKSYGGRPALSDAELSLARGEIQALLGENGAGKTTLMNVLYGLLAPDSGRMELEGEPFAPRSPRDAVRAGVGMVHQHFMLVPTLTVAENIVLGETPFSRYDRTALVDRIAERMAKLGFDLPLEKRVDALSVGEKQRVEIFKLLWKGARLLILDEPTAVLTPQETDTLFVLLRRLRDEGRTILFISHRLSEIRDLCDRVTLLRKGKTVGQLEVSNTDRAELSRLMLGRDLEPLVKPTRTPLPNPERFILECDRLRGKKVSGKWTCQIESGQIAVIVGIEGNGQKELAEAIVGVSPLPGFSLRRGDTPFSPGVRNRIDEGIGFISEDRQGTGLVLEFSIGENFALKDIGSPPWSRRGLLRPVAFKETGRELTDRFDIQPADPQLPVGNLSGGNQQKVALAREISREHRFLVAANPTRGLDAGACETVRAALVSEASNGSAILLLTADLEEALDLADALYVICAGEVAPLPRSEWTREAIGLAMLGETTSEAIA